MMQMGLECGIIGLFYLVALERPVYRIKYDDDENKILKY